MTQLSVLDLSPIPQGADAAQALRNSRDLAGHAERLGYRRYWLAEHHNMPGVASAATAVAIGFVAEGTRTIRVGAGGIMLPNHAPLVIAEQFGTLASLYPDRIDLGLGRAPGTDQLTARALRRTLTGDIDDFPRDVMELMAYFADPAEGQAVRAVPGQGLKVPLYILGSSTYGAQLAAALGLPFAFASHFCAAGLGPRAPPLPGPVPALGDAAAAPCDGRAERLRRAHRRGGAAPVHLLAAGLRQSADRSRRPLPPPVDDIHALYPAAYHGMLDETLARSVVGGPETVARGLAEFAARTGANEIIVTTQMFDHAARIRSFEIAADVAQSALAA